MPVISTLRLENKDQVIEMYLNNDNEIYIQDITDPDSPCSFWFCLSKDDWDEVKQFIDDQFKTNG